MSKDPQSTLALLNAPWPQSPDQARAVHSLVNQHMQGMSRLDPSYQLLTERLDQIAKVAFPKPPPEKA